MALVLWLAAAAATPVSAKSDAVDGFHCNTAQQTPWADHAAIDAAYGMRSAAILSAALDQDVRRLKQMVAPTATFTLWHADLATRVSSPGPEAAIDFAQRVAPVDYQFSTEELLVSDRPCGEKTVELLLGGREPGSAVRASFKFDGGVLREVSGQFIGIVRGEFGRPRTR